MVSHAHLITKKLGRRLGWEEVPFLCREDQTLKKVLGARRNPMDFQVVLYTIRLC